MKYFPFPSIFNNNKQPKQPKKTLEPHLLKSATFPSPSSSSSLETMIGGVKSSKRLFFEPVETSSILAQAKSPFKGSVAHVIESDDPYLDFKKSMHEIIESQGIELWKDWECLEKMLGWYLRMNEKNNHSFVVGAFVDLLLGFTPKKKATTCPDNTTTYCSAASSLSPPSSLRL